MSDSNLNLIDTKVALISECSEEMRRMADREYTLTTACVGSFAAMAVGIAAFYATAGSNQPPQSWNSPSHIAVFWIVSVAFIVILKLLYSHSGYAEIKAARAHIVRDLQEVKELKAVIPEGLASAEVGGGVFYSIVIILLAAAGSVWVCLKF
jgi:heme/copper-type cytochrome/quinol oxidase subunit 2